MNEQASVGLGYYLFVLKRQWVTILAMTVIGVVAMAAYLALVPGKVVASTAVNVNVIVSDPFNPSRPASGLLDTATEAKLATSYVVAAAAAKSLDSTESADELRSGVSVTTGINATIVTISYAAPTEQRARAGADAVATAYLGYRQSKADATKKKMIGNLEEQLGALNKTAAALGNVDKAAINGRISNVEYQINQLTTIDTNGGTVITPATQNPVVTTPQPSLLLVSGLLIGCVLGIVLAFVINALARRVRDPHDVEKAEAGPVILALDSPTGIIPPKGAELVAFRSLRERLLAATDSDIGVLAVIDETVAWAASDVGQGLAVVLAQAGHNVELVLMGSTSTQKERLKDELALAPATTGTHADSSVLASTLIPKLSIVYPLGNDADSDTDNHVTDAVRRRVERRLPGVTVVLVLPPKAAASSRLAVARLARSTLIVAERRRTAMATLATRVHELADLDARYHGVVLVRVSRKQAHVREGAAVPPPSEKPAVTEQPEAQESLAK